MYDKPILMNPNVPQEVRIINAISEQLFNSWPVSIIMIDLEDCIWRLNQQVMNELQLNEHVIGRHITDLLEVVCDKKNVLEALLLQLRERDVRIIPLDTNCFIRELKSGISFLIQGAMVGIHEDGQLVRIVLYFRNVLEERTQKHLLNIALSRTQLLMVLISDILDLSKIESNTMEFHFEKVSLNGILESIYSAQKMNLRKGVELLLDLPDRAAVIYTDPTRLGQVVNNLINNAVKFTAEGRITIGYRLKDFATLEVFVEDTGTGMSEEVLAHIFERFYKGDAFVQGTGLGLAICRTIVERFHGKIEVASTLGKGSRFAIVLPQEMRE